MLLVYLWDSTGMVKIRFLTVSSRYFYAGRLTENTLDRHVMKKLQYLRFYYSNSFIDDLSYYS